MFTGKGARESAGTVAMSYLIKAGNVQVISSVDLDKKCVECKDLANQDVQLVTDTKGAGVHIFEMPQFTITTRLSYVETIKLRFLFMFDKWKWN